MGTVLTAQGDRQTQESGRVKFSVAVQFSRQLNSRYWLNTESSSKTTKCVDHVRFVGITTKVNKTMVVRPTVGPYSNFRIKPLQSTINPCYSNNAVLHKTA